MTSKTNWQDEFGKWLVAMPTRKARRRSELTLQAYGRDVKLFALWFETKNLVRFTPDLLNDVDVQSYFEELGQRGKPATFNRKLASMRMLISWARSTGQLGHDPAAWISFVDATRESPRDVNDDERARLEQAAEGRQHDLLGLRDRVIFELMNCAGMRISEVVGLRLDDLHLEDGYIHVLGKGQKHRKIRGVSGKLAGLIMEWLEKGPASVDGRVVTDLSGRKIGREDAWRRFKKIADDAGVNSTPHAMRHTFIYRFMRNYMAGDQERLPAAIDAVCQQTGDRAEVILQYYTRARESDIRAAMEAM